MSARRNPASRARRLLRWYPRTWRETNGPVLLATMEEQWDDQARRGDPVGLSVREAWSLRLHGGAERLSPGAGAVLAAAGAVVMLAGTVLFFAPWSPALSTAAVTLAVGVGPAMAWAAAVALVRDVTWVPAWAAMLSVVAAAAASAAFALAVLSWSVGFQRADAGVDQSLAGNAFLGLGPAAVVLAAVALVPLAEPGLRRVGSLRRRPRARWAVAVACSVPLTVAVAVALAMAGGPLLAAGALFIGCGLRWRSGRGATRSAANGTPADEADQHERAQPAERAAATHGPTGATLGEPTPRPLVDHRVRTDARTRRRAAVLSWAAVPATTICAVYALLGERWAAPTTGELVEVGGVGETGGAGLWAWLTGLPSMNAGLAAGSAACLLLVAAGGLLAARRWGRLGVLATVLVAASFALHAVSAAMGPSGDTQTYLLFLATALLGVGAAVPVDPYVPLPPAARWAVVGLVGVVAGWTFGPVTVAGLPLAAPAVALVMAIWLTRRPAARPAPTTGPLPVIA